MSASELLKAVAILLFVLPGMLSFGVALFGGSWFVESRSAAPVRRYMGRSGTRFFYAVLGLCLVAAGVLIWFDPRGVFAL